jgi:hypothetical protein
MSEFVYLTSLPVLIAETSQLRGHFLNSATLTAIDAALTSATLSVSILLFHSSQQTHITCLNDEVARPFIHKKKKKKKNKKAKN